MITAGPGRGLFEWFGHSGIEVANLATGERRFYEYGVMAPGRDAFRAALTGELLAFTAVMPSSRAMRRFESAGRSVHIQRLRLTDAQKSEVLSRLNADVRRGRGSQRYRVVTDNCATKPRNLIDEVTGGALRMSGRRSLPATLRDNVLLLPMPPPVKLLIDFAFNGSVDGSATLWEEAALPSKLEELAGSATIRDMDGGSHPLVSHAWRIGEDWVPDPGPGAADMLIAGLCLALLLAALQSPFPQYGFAARTAGANILLSIALGIPGLTLLVSWAFTGYEFAQHNANLFIANPLLLAIPFAMTRPGAERWIHRIWVAAAGVATLGGCVSMLVPNAQHNLGFILFVLPLSITQAVMPWIESAARRWRSASMHDAHHPVAPRPDHHSGSLTLT